MSSFTRLNYESVVYITLFHVPIFNTFTFSITFSNTACLICKNKAQQGSYITFTTTVFMYIQIETNMKMQQTTFWQISH